MSAVLAEINFSEGIEAAWSRIASFVPKFLGFLVILIIGYFVAKAISRILARILDRVGFNRAVERGGIAKAMERTRYDASDIVSKIVFYLIFLFVLQLAFGVFGPNPISRLIEGIIAFLPRLLVAIVIVVVAAAVAAAVREILQAALGGLSYGKVLANVAAAAIIVIGIFAALDQVQIAPRITTGLFYALLAIVAGSAIVAIGGGGIAPMRAQWERAMGRIQQEAPRLRQEAQGSKERIRQRAEERAGQLREQAPGQPGTGARLEPSG